MEWRDDGDGCHALIYNGTVIAAFGPDKSKEGWYRGFAFNAKSGEATHESMWGPESLETIKHEIETWFSPSGELLNHTERKKLYDSL